MIKNNNKGEFGTIYTQFENKPVQAIKFLIKKKDGECTKVFYRKEIGYIDIVWGKVTDPINHKGFGLAHIIDKHETDIKKLGFDIANFIAIVVQFGNLSLSKSKEEYLLESDNFRVVIESKYKGNKKNWILTAFNLQQKKGKEINLCP